MRKNSTQDIKSIIKDFMRESNLAGRFTEQDVIDSWTEIVGPVFSRYTSKISLYNGVLHVSISSSAARQELSMARSVLLKTINARFSETVVNDIMFHP